MDCVFCKIISGDIPSYTIFEDDIVKVFLDINPLSNGHVLIIPKEHFLNIDDISNDVLVHIMDVARDVKKLLEDKLHCDGVTFIQNNGECQDVKHYHMHVKPFYKKEMALMDVKDVYCILSNR